MTERSKLPAAVTGLRRKMRVNDLIVDVRAMVAAGRRNRALPKPFAALDRLAKALEALDAAQVATKTRAAGTVEARNVAAERVHKAVAQYASAVQTVADADPANGVTIIVDSGLRTRRASRRRKVPFGVKPGRVSRSLVAQVKSVAKRASYEWEISLDGGETWVPVGTTLETQKVIPDLPLGKYVQVRVRPLTKNGVGDWIGPITALVI